MFDNATQKAEHLVSRAGWLDSAKMALMEPMKFKARDGLEIEVFVTVPKGSTGKGLPLLIPSGMAFGTGSHPTTRLCLEWLDRVITGGETVIDYGCGSGILALAASRLGGVPPTSATASWMQRAMTAVESNRVPSQSKAMRS